MKKIIITLIFAGLATSILATEIPGTNGIPDLTKGGTLRRVNLRWAGPVGVYLGAWRLRGRQKPEDVRQLQVLSIMKGSPADGVLKIDDVILGADGTGAAQVPLFQGAAKSLMPLADAINEAEARNPAILKLLVWRPTGYTDPASAGSSWDSLTGKPENEPVMGPAKEAPEEKVDPYREVNLDNVQGLLNPYNEGETITVEIKLKTLGRYSDTAPYNCEKSKKILRMGLEALYQSDKPGTGGLGILCLLAGDDPTNPENAKYQAKAREWVYRMIENTAENYGSPWVSGPRLIAFSEYYMKTKDPEFLPELKKRAEYHASRVSWIGTSGHRWADKLPDGSRGRISGYGAINCSGVLGFLGLTLAQKAGVDSPIVDDAVNRQRIFFGHYAERGNIIYGEYYYGIGGGMGDSNGKHAMPALALGVLGEERKAKYFTRMTALSGCRTRLYAHAGPFFGTVWQPVAAAQGGVKTAHYHFEDIRWHLDLKRHYNGLRIYDPTHRMYGDFSEAATALLFYAAPLKSTVVTGRGRSKSLELTEEEFAETVATRAFDESKLSNDELIDSLSRYMGMLRTKAANELGRRAKADPEKAKVIITKLLAVAGDKTASPTGRGGACRSLMEIKRKAREPISSLMNEKITKTGIAMVQEPNSYIRYAGARILHFMPPETVRPYGNDLMDAILAIDRPTFPLHEDNPCRWDHGVMGEVFILKVLNHGVGDLNREKLIPVIRSLLATPMSVARTTTARGIHSLSREDTLSVAGSIIECMKRGAPFNAAGDGAAPAVQKLLAKHHFEEGLYLSLLHNPTEAARDKIPQAYGRAALHMQSIRDILNLVGDRMLIEGSAGTDKVVPQLLKGDGPDTLNTLKVIHAVKAADRTLTLPANRTELVVDATNYALPDEGDTTYTWRKRYGAGNVSFSPNGSAKSKKTTVTFTDAKPGKYSFEVTMSDTLGINTIKETVEVTLTDRRGMLPRNRPPQAQSQSLDAVPGVALPVTLSGADPDGDDLGYVVTTQPEHGRLSGVGGKLVYTPNYGNPLIRNPKAEAEEPTSPETPSLDDFDDLDPFGGPAIQPKSNAPESKKTSHDSWKDSFTFEAIDGQGQRAKGTVTFIISDKNVGVAVYEGFDYPTGRIINQQNEASFGFSGPWRKSDGKSGRHSFLVTGKSLDNPDENPSLYYPGMPSTGGKMYKGESHRSCVRMLDPTVLAEHKLLENDHVLWFGLYISSGVSFELQGRNTRFGFYTDAIHIFATYNGKKKAGKNRNPYTRSGKLRMLDKTSMIIGRCTWGKTDKDVDRVEIFRVFDVPEFGPILVENPVCVLEKVIPQNAISTIKIHNTSGTVDEIRIGPTLSSVMLGTKAL